MKRSFRATICFDTEGEEGGSYEEMLMRQLEAIGCVVFRNVGVPELIVILPENDKKGT